MGIGSTLSGNNPSMSVPPGGMQPYDETTNPYGLQEWSDPGPMPWGNYGGYDTPQQRGIANAYGPETAWGNAGKLQPQVMPPEFNMPGAPATQGFANTAYQSPWNTGGISGLASGPNSFIPTPTGGAQPMLDLLARQRETYLPMLAGLPAEETPPGTPPVTPPPGTPPGDPPPGGGTPGGTPPTTPPTTPTYPGDGSVQDYIDQWLLDNPNYIQDYIDNQIGGGIGGFDPSQFMTNQDFQDWFSNYQPESTDMSGYMTNPAFQDYMSNYQPDFSNYMSNQAFQDYMGNYQPESTDMSNYMTNQSFQDYMGNYQPDIDTSNYMTNQAFQDYMRNNQPDFSNYVTQGGLNTALQGLGSLNTANPSVADYSYNVNPFAR